MQTLLNSIQEKRDKIEIEVIKNIENYEKEYSESNNSMLQDALQVWEHIYI